jgi:hypothetical protein
MHESDADDCRNKAQHCIDHAARTIIRREARAWLKLASDWINLAEDFDRLDQLRPRWMN